MKSITGALLLTVTMFSSVGLAADISLDGAQIFKSDDGAKLFAALPNDPPSDRDDSFPPEDGDPVDPPACEDNYFDWGQGRDGSGYCYEFFRDGSIANGGRNLANRFCEGVAPSYYDMARGRDGYFYCYQFTPNHLVMNQGRPVPQGNCQR